MTDKLQQALTLHRQGELDSAHQIYSELLKQNPEDADVIYLISLVALQINKHIDAINILVHAIQQNDTEPRYLFAMGYISQDLGWDEQAQNAYEKAIVLKPDFSEAFSNMGNLHTEFNRYPQAMQCYQAAINTNAKTYSAYIGLAVTLLRMGLKAEAIETIELAIKIQPAVSQPGESAEQSLERLASSKPILYQPPVVCSESRTEPSGIEAPHIRKPKPKLRILHQLPISGGAMIAKCVAVLPSICLFNNIHPRNPEVKTYGQNIFFQADQWYHLFTGQDKQELSGKNLSYDEGIRLIHDRLMQRDKIMVIRSWSHLDFMGAPFIDAPAYTLALTEVLKDAFDLRQAATLCHPIANWKNLCQLQIMHGSLTLDNFMRGYLAFAEATESMGRIQYEQFMSNPEAEMKKLCTSLELPYDASFLERWKFEMRIGSEPGDNPESIHPLKEPHYNSPLVESFEANFDYWPSLKVAGYEHPEISETTH